MTAAILAVVGPVFFLIGAGWLASITKKISDVQVDALLAFVVRFAVPTLLFSALYDLDLTRVFSAPTLIAYYVGAFASFGLGALLGWAMGRRPGEQVAIGFTAFFSNTLLLGLPIITRAYGDAALEPMLGVVAFHAPLLYTFGMIAMEVSRRDGAGAAEAVRRAWRNISSNSLMIGIVVGLSFNLLGLDLPTSADEAVDLLASAAAPTGLFAIGAALSRYQLKDDLALAAGLSAILLIAHPLIAWVLASAVFGLPIDFVRAAVVTAAMPAGMNVYIFAAMYHRAEGAAASAILLSTAFSIITISLWLAFLGGVGTA